MLNWNASYTDPNTGAKYEVQWKDGHRTELALAIHASHLIQEQHGIRADTNAIVLWDTV